MLMMRIYNRIKENTENLIDASKEVGLAVTAEKNLSLSRPQNAGQDFHIKITSTRRSFESVQS
jgi:hypothetical protein